MKKRIMFLAFAGWMFCTLSSNAQFSLSGEVNFGHVLKLVMGQKAWQQVIRMHLFLLRNALG